MVLISAYSKQVYKSKDSLEKVKTKTKHVIFYMQPNPTQLILKNRENTKKTNKPFFLSSVVEIPLYTYVSLSITYFMYFPTSDIQTTIQGYDPYSPV